NERLEGVLSRWLLLKNNTIPTIKKALNFNNIHEYKGVLNGEFNLFNTKW
ncbi:TPA: hypothetical protein N7D96_005497, partial [Escherichia coli]